MTNFHDATSKETLNYSFFQFATAKIYPPLPNTLLKINGVEFLG
jgi:hypothetical protein